MPGGEPGASSSAGRVGVPHAGSAGAAYGNACSGPASTPAPGTNLKRERRKVRTRTCSTLPRPADCPEGRMPMAGFWSYAQTETQTTSRSGSTPTAPSTRRRPARGRTQPARPHRAAALGWSRATPSPRSCPTAAHPTLVLPRPALAGRLVYVPINYRLSPPEIAYILEDCDAKAFFTHERFADVAARGGRRGRHPGRRPARARRRARASGRSTSSSTGSPPRCRTTAPPARRCTTRRARPAARRA